MRSIIFIAQGYAAIAIILPACLLTTCGGGWGSDKVHYLETNSYVTAVGDMNGDGAPDVVSASLSDEKVAWYDNLGGGSFGPQQIISTSANDPISVAAVDFNGDFEAAFAEGAPSLLRCESLKVSGKLSFPAGVECRGAVEFINTTAKPHTVKPGIYSNTQVRF